MVPIAVRMAMSAVRMAVGVRVRVLSVIVSHRRRILLRAVTRRRARVWPLPSARMPSFVRPVLLAQSLLYLVTGPWPLLHMASFEAVTGAKTDDWLVHTVGLLLAVIGGVLLAASRRPSIDRLFLLLAIGTALALAAVEIFYVSRGAISRIYLLDTGIELVFAALLVTALLRTRRHDAAN